ncbi:MAG: HEAT repeat domain-containing protein [Planctomycetes bacterium]|nr:HEAT repeat domain-containing protein [Planctomycetota bacterium]
MVEFVETERTVPCAAPPEETLKALELTAAAFDGRVSTRRPADSWRVSAGTWLATNPNEATWKLRVTREKDTLRLAAEPSFFPWTRAKVARITSARLRPFADALAQRLAGGPSRPLTPQEAAPFAGGSLCFAITGHAASMASAMAVVFVALTLASLQIIQALIPTLADRAAILQRIGYPALPSPVELAGFGLWDRLGAAALLAMPIAFFMGLAHALVHIVGEHWRAMARVAPFMAGLLALFCLAAFAPVMPLWSAAVHAFLVPFAAQVGTTLVWGRRREILRPAPIGRRRIVLRIAGAVAILLAAVPLVPHARSLEGRLDAIAIFRDRILLTNGFGRTLARAYYRWTPYAAEPLKELYDSGPEGYDRAVRTALVFGYERGIVQELRRRHFAVDWGLPSAWSKLWGGDMRSRIAEARHDLYVVIDDHNPDAGEELRRAGLAHKVLYVGALDLTDLVATTPSELAKNGDALLHTISRNDFAAGTLRELTAQGWQAIYYLGLPFLLALGAGGLCVPIGILYRKTSRRVAHGGLLASTLVAVAGLALIYRAVPAGERSPDALAHGLDSPRAEERHEAAYLLCRAMEDKAFPRSRFAARLAHLATTDPDVRVRLWAAAGAGATGEVSVRPSLLQALEDPELFVRYRAAEGLGELAADPAAAEALQRMMRTGSWYEGLYALGALRRIEPDRW